METRFHKTSLSAKNINKYNFLLIYLNEVVEWIICIQIIKNSEK